MASKNHPEQLRQRLELRRGNAGGAHLDKRTRRLRTRSASERHSIRESVA